MILSVLLLLLLAAVAVLRVVEQRADLGQRARVMARRRAVLTRHKWRNRWMAVVVRRERVHRRRHGGQARRIRRGRPRRLEGRRHKRPSFVRELLWTRARVRALEETTFIAELFQAYQPCESGRPTREKVRTTFPGVKLERRQVDVSVVRQL